MKQLQQFQFPQGLWDEVVFERKSSRPLAVQVVTKATATNIQPSAGGEKHLGKHWPQTSHQQQRIREEKHDNENPEPMKKKEPRGEKLPTKVGKQFGHEKKESRPCRAIPRTILKRRGCGR